MCLLKKALPLKLLDMKYSQECINLALVINEMFVILLYFMNHYARLIMIETLIKSFGLNLEKINKVLS